MASPYHVGFDIGGGNKIDYNDDDVLEAQGAAATDADVTIGYNGWTLAVDQAGIDNLFDDDHGRRRRDKLSLVPLLVSGAVAVTSDQEGSTSSYSSKRRRCWYIHLQRLVQTILMLVAVRFQDCCIIRNGQWLDV